MKANVLSSVVAVCISEIKGTVKSPVSVIHVKANQGIAGDAHAGEPLRQISLLAVESVEKLRDLRGKTPSFEAGAFAENILTSGICLHKLPISTHLRVGTTLLEVTQIGKDCHNDGCAIKRQTGDCVMPREGIFTVVLEDGTVKPGDMVKVV